MLDDIRKQASGNTTEPTQDDNGEPVQGVISFV